MELIFFAYTPPLDGKNTASEEHKGVIINYIKNCCSRRSDMINQSMMIVIVVLIWLLSLWFTTKSNFLMIDFKVKSISFFLQNCMF